MKYLIRPVLPKCKELQEIDEAEYKEITQAIKLAWDILLVKEHFSYVARNFALLENEIKKIEIKANKNLKDDLKEFWEKSSNGDFHRENAHIFNLLVTNLLTTCRTYLELFDYKGQNRQRKAFFEEEEIRQALKQIKEKYHRQDDILCIFFWTLRNYAQHHARPISRSPSNINGQGVKINLTIDAEKVFSTLTEKRLNQLEVLGISNPTNCLRVYIEENLPNIQLSKYPKTLPIRLLVKEYILLLRKINDEFNQELNLSFQEAKDIVTQKVKFYCQDDSPGSAFEVYKQNKDNEKLEKLFDICLKLIIDWEEIIKKYSNLDFIDNTGLSNNE